MMNVIALGLLISSLVAAGVWSPPNEQKQQQHQGEDYSNSDNVILKEGHRLIVVEYEREGLRKLTSRVPETPSLDEGSQSQSPLKEVERETLSGIKEKAEEKFHEAASVLPNLGQGVSIPTPHPSEATHGTKERICDAYGRCKDKITGLLGKTKEKVAEEVGDVEDKVERVKESAKDAGGSVADKAKHAQEKVADKMGEVKESAKETGESVADKAKHAKEKVADKMGEVKESAKDAGESVAGKVKHAKDKVAEKVGQVEESAKDAGESVAEKAKHAKERAVKESKKVKEVVAEKAKGAEQMAENLYESAENVVEVVEKSRQAGQKAMRAVDEGQRNISEIIGRARDVAYDAAMYLISPPIMSSFLNLVHLLAFAVSYGMCVWVTFVSSHVLARVLPRQQFGVAQSKIYPVYFQAMAYGVGATMLAHFLNQRGRNSGNQAERLQSYNLLGSLGFVLANMVYLEPRASKVMFERLKLEKEEGRGRDMADMVAEPVTPPTVTTATATTDTGAGQTFTATTATRGRVADKEALKSRVAKLNERLRALNTYSSFVNVMGLVGLTWHLVYLSQRMSC